jgi:hypothetical protein
MARQAAPRVEHAARRNPAVVYIRRLWLGELPLSRVFWTDMLVIGTVVNIAAGIAAMLLFVSGAPIAIGVAVHFAPLPYNLLLFFAVWQAASREASGWSFPAQVGAFLWFFVAFVI